jgi:nucleotide-binding universal stress UspA family protein
VGKHYEEILKMADKWGADLIVVYHNRRRTVNEAFSQTCAQRVVKDANCSVLRLRNLFK